MLDGSCAPHLDHVFLTVDSETMDDILADKVLNDAAFCRFKVKKATSTLLGPYETANVLGESTFVEFFPHEKPPFPNISLGIVLSFDTPGEAADAAMQLVQDGGVGFEYELNRREIPGYDRPQEWYRLLRPDLGENSPITVFLSEITESYFDILGASRNEKGEQPRGAYLDAAVGEPHRPEQMFRNISEVTLRLGTGRTKTLTRLLTTLGYEKSEDAEFTILRGPEATVKVVTDDDLREGLLKLRLELLHASPDQGQVLAFGSDSQLTLSPDGLNDPTAIWTFVPPEIQQMEA